ncbi:hypothetical protein GLYMA_19G100600v4 [Glycine max]|uniref:Uncharacterized protein n=1 Tax=Glycine max TaxID=3847 RepID=K7MXL3_SOYBN|nr:hypothetical protein JHK87_053100 [Glycine soja]KAH1077159.1 hypothetical protein GYH30_052599 [Glycine max]KRG94668.1 hypothetical protein GLYMA_19G100600v4 [Glycine max]
MGQAILISIVLHFRHSQNQEKSVVQFLVHMLRHVQVHSQIHITQQNLRLGQNTEWP